ncbi:hypothetical protein QA601_07820 [Chitinispirillales bacterium ANBcel5]|uniref:hypothetical protein n=1 Tax=Cellulosispirillum alkaliphilum TaxID=3039283 RepID=UPI002A522800|nr:hypothetical protein [Chitinispirillales bacterium ANBcel5]
MLLIKSAILGTLILALSISANHHSDDHSGHHHMTTENNSSEQKTCPVMGGEINEDLYVDQDGKRIYLCCQGCSEEVKENFHKHSAKLKESGQGPHNLSKEVEQKNCPVMNGEINTELYTEIEGQKIYVCCPGCIDKVEANPEKFLSMVLSDDASKE